MDKTIHFTQHDSNISDKEWVKVPKITDNKDKSKPDVRAADDRVNPAYRWHLGAK